MLFHSKQLGLLLGLAAAAAPAAWACKTDSDCSLNGRCAPTHVCACDKPWGSANCGELQYKLTPASGKNLYDTSDPRNTWVRPLVAGRVRIRPGLSASDVRAPAEWPDRHRSRREIPHLRPALQGRPLPLACVIRLSPSSRMQAHDLCHSAVAFLTHAGRRKEFSRGLCACVSHGRRSMRGCSRVRARGEPDGALIGLRPSRSDRIARGAAVGHARHRNQRDWAVCMGPLKGHLPGASRPPPRNSGTLPSAICQRCPCKVRGPLDLPPPPPRIVSVPQRTHCCLNDGCTQAGRR